MKRAVKWMLIIVGGLLVLTIAALLLIPSFVDVQKYRAEIENRVSQIAGVPVTIGGDLRLSIIPWLGVAVSDVHIGNPEGFQGKEALKKTLEKGILGQKQMPPEAPKEGSSQQEKPKTPEEKAKELLKGLPFGK